MILDNCDIGRRSKIRRAILDKNVRVPPDSTIGYDLVAGPAALSRDGNRHRGSGRKPVARRHLVCVRITLAVLPSRDRKGAVRERSDRAHLKRFLNAKSNPTYPFSSRVRIADHRRLKSHSTWNNCVLVLETSEM